MDPVLSSPWASYAEFMQSPAVDNLGTEQGEHEAGGANAAEHSVRTRPAGRTKLPNFNCQEDTNLCYCWLAVSSDPIINTGQKRQGFWSRVTEACNNRRGNNPERSTKSLISRWDTIKSQCSLFSSYLSHVLRENPSGLSDADKTSLAAARFASLEKKPFNLMHCWNVLKDEPKWMDSCREDGTGAQDDTPIDSNTVEFQPNESSADCSRGKRPAGRDASKASLKKTKSGSTTATSSDEHLDRLGDLSLRRLSVFEDAVAIEQNKVERLDEFHSKQLEIEEKRLQIELERLERQKRIEDEAKEERILAIDLNTCNPAQRAYYKKLQEQILAKVNADPSRIE